MASSGGRALASKVSQDLLVHVVNLVDTSNPYPWLSQETKLPRAPAKNKLTLQQFMVGPQDHVRALMHPQLGSS